MFKIHTDKNVADLLTKAFDVKTINGESQLHALVDGKKIIITESSVRRDLQLADENDIDCLPNSTIFEQLALMGPKTTAWNEFSSTMASAIICLATNQKFNFSKLIFDSMIRNLDNASGKFLMYPRRVGKGFSGRVTPLFPTMVVQNQSQMGEGSSIPTDPHHTPTFIQPSPQPQKTQKPRKPKRKDTQIPQSSDPSDNVADEDSGNIDKTQSKATPNESSSLGTTSGGGPRCQETMGDTIAQTRRVKKLEKKNRSRTHKLKRLYKVGLTARVESSDDEESLGEDASKQGRINAIDADEEITLVSVHDMNASAGEEVAEEVVEVINTAKLIIDAAQVSAAGDKVSTASAATTVSAATTTTAIISIVDDITLAQALEEMKSTKPKNKGIVIQELGESTTKISSQMPLQQTQDKGKGILIEPVKKKDQILLDEETALKLQVEFDEEERLAREKVEKVQEANIALIETWDDIQAKIDVDHQLAERMQAQEQEELSVEENATLFQQLLEKRRKHFAVKRPEEKRNKPPTKAQQRKIMCTYLKNMEGYKLNDLKLKEFDYIPKMFEDFRTELVEGKEKRAETKLAQEITKKQKVEDDKETVEIKKLMELIPDEEEVAIDAIHFAVKSPSIVDWKIHKEYFETKDHVHLRLSISSYYLIIAFSSFFMNLPVNTT
ncbi:hypothetical protein Tco_1187587 [Tanacetum coccineum]